MSLDKLLEHPAIFVTTVRFVSCLVGNPEDRFYLVAARTIRLVSVSVLSC